uniref:ANF_receptor domain-containing protein n=2 Tax=Caenorhabditis tropicalis TaxID=1561998 RepID=A0A1I7T406_9PELO
MSEMSVFIQVLPLALLALCHAQDSGLYVNRIRIETFHNNQGNDKSFTYYLANSYYQSQIDNYKTNAGSIGTLYEDDLATHVALCNEECPNLRRAYSYLSTDGGITTTRIIDDNIKKSDSAASSAKPIGLVAPYPGYCSSDDSLPIIEMFSDALKQYAYWSPAQPNQLVNLASTAVDKSRYNPVRLVGYGLSPSTDKLVLENTFPDYKSRSEKPITNDENMINLATFSIVDNFDKTQYPNTKNTGIFLLARAVTAQNTKLEAVCGERIAIYAAWNSADRKFISLFPKDVKAPNIAHSQAGWTFKTNKPACGGIKGLAELFEFSHNSKPGYFTYANDQTKIQELLGSGWSKTPKVLGYAPLDQIGFLLINAVM